MASAYNRMGVAASSGASGRVALPLHTSRRGYGALSPGTPVKRSSSGMRMGTRV
jgi:hypothetical protein